MDSAKEAGRRAAARAAWPGLKTSLTEAPGAENLSASTTAEQRLGMMWELTLGAWSLTGLPLPDYTRQTMPGRLVRPGDR